MTTDETVVDVSQDWVLACDVQQRFMQSPHQTSDSMDYSARCRQIRAIGGDCYDFMPLGDGALALLVGDASGKGLAAALMIANVQSSLRTAAMFKGDDLAALFNAVNVQAYTSSLADRYVTVFFGVFDRGTRTLRYVNAGHNPPLVLRHDGEVQWLESGGAPVGMFPDSSYEESVIQFNPGDLIISYTDGIIEARNSAGEEWGVQGLLKAAIGLNPHFSGTAKNVVQSIFNCVDDFSHGCQSDDATLSVLRVG